MENLFDFQDDNIEVNNYIDKNGILKYITEEEIFEYVLKFKPNEFDYICSPLREDRNPGAYFQRYNNKLLFIDWADPFCTHYNCFDFIKRYYHLSDFYTVLKFIEDNIINKREIKSRVEEKKGEEVKRKAEILIETRPFNNTDGLYWSKYGISKKNLIQDKVFAVSKVRVKNKKDREFPVYTKCFAYTNFPEGRKKLYFPFKKGRGRFLSTCTKNDINTDHLIKVPQLVITKSYKDYRVLRNLGTNVIWFQNEGAFPDNLKEITSGYKEVVVFFDNDNKGIVAANNLIKEIGETSRKIHLSISLLEQGIKDASDMWLHKGENELKLFLIKNKIKLYESIRHNS